MKDIDIITTRLSNLEENILSQEAILKLIRDVTHNNEVQVLKNLRQNGKIKTIFLKYYYVVSENERKNNSLKYYSFELVFGVLNKLNIKWYISFAKGLELKNILWQSHKKFSIINNKISRKCIIHNTEFEFKKTNAKYINNFSQNKTKNRITQNIGTTEKIFVDYVYFNKKVPKELQNGINATKVKEIIQNYSKNFQKKVKDMIR